MYMCIYLSLYIYIYIQMYRHIQICTHVYTTYIGPAGTACRITSQPSRPKPSELHKQHQ